MIHNILFYESDDGESVSVHKNDDGAYVLSVKGVDIATLTDFEDAMTLFLGRVNGYTQGICRREIGL